MENMTSLYAGLVAAGRQDLAQDLLPEEIAIRLLGENKHLRRKLRFAERELGEDLEMLARIVDEQAILQWLTARYVLVRAHVHSPNCLNAEGRVICGKNAYEWEPAGDSVENLVNAFHGSDVSAMLRKMNTERLNEDYRPPF